MRRNDTPAFRRPHPGVALAADPGLAVATELAVRRTEIVAIGDDPELEQVSIDNIPIILTDANNKTQFAGKDWNPTPAKAKSVGFIPGAAKPYVHRISNQGQTAYHVIDVEVLP